jgi:uncharacterized protein YjbI with pentapeptide repeats
VAIRARVAQNNGARRLLFAPQRTDPPLPRSPIAFLSRSLLVLVMASFGAMFAATRALAGDDGQDTARLLSFGGMCLNCELSGRKLPEAKFMGANFAGASMVGSDLHGASFFGSNFSGADLAKADLHGAILFGSDFTNTDFSDANLSGVRGHGANFLGANLSRANLDGANLLGAELARVTARDAQFAGATLFGANLSQGHFEHANFRNANLIGVNLAGADLAGADVTAANFAHANIASSDLSQARGLTQAQLDVACGGPSTRLPPGLVARACKAGIGNVIILRSTPPIHAGAPRYIVELAVP